MSISSASSSSQYASDSSSSSIRLTPENLAIYERKEGKRMRLAEKIAAWLPPMIFPSSLVFFKEREGVLVRIESDLGDIDPYAMRGPEDKEIWGGMSEIVYLYIHCLKSKKAPADKNIRPMFCEIKGFLEEEGLFFGAHEEKSAEVEYIRWFFNGLRDYWAKRWEEKFPLTHASIKYLIEKCLDMLYWVHIRDQRERYTGIFLPLTMNQLEKLQGHVAECERQTSKVDLILPRV